MLSFVEGVEMTYRDRAKVDVGGELSNEWRIGDPDGKFSAWSGYSVKSADSINIVGNAKLSKGYAESYESGIIINGVDARLYCGAMNSKAHSAASNIEAYDEEHPLSLTYSNTAFGKLNAVSTTQSIKDASGTFKISDESAFYPAPLATAGSETITSLTKAMDYIEIYNGKLKSVTTGASVTPVGVASVSIGKTTIESAVMFKGQEAAGFEKVDEEKDSILRLQSITDKEAQEGKKIVYSGSAVSSEKQCVAGNTMAASSVEYAVKKSNIISNDYWVFSNGGVNVPAGLSEGEVDGLPIVGESSAEFADKATSSPGMALNAETFEAYGKSIIQNSGALISREHVVGDVQAFAYVTVGDSETASNLIGSSTIKFDKKGTTIDGSWSGTAAKGAVYERLGQAMYMTGFDESGSIWLRAFVATGKPRAFKFKEHVEATFDGKVLDAQ
jgi:hypothetical protein